ncbi:MAG: 3-hydroxyacyl-ACP dehydratase FabZ family protein [Pirellulales bacterium]|jgi:3-hydroxyacyl-[acyl-carrier-protein] dehydratase
MRWFWIDRFTSFESGRSARAVKCVSIAEEQCDEYFPGHPIMPHTLVIEGLAQSGGLLVSETRDFKIRLVLAKIARVHFYDSPRPGEQLRYEVIIQSLQDEGALVAGTVHVEDRLLAEADLYFARVDGVGGRELFTPIGLLRMLRCFRLFEVAVDRDGNRLPIPEHLLQAERDELAQRSGE